MDNTGSSFFRKIDANEQKRFISGGNIQYHNSGLCRNFDYLSHLDNTLGGSDDFYRALRRTVVKTDDPPLALIIILYLFAAAFFAVVVITDMNGINAVGLIAFSVLVFIIPTVLLIYRIVKKNGILKCVKRRENIYAVSLKINGTRAFTDNMSDDNVTLH
ncbi:hypothetical protein [Huintestinicola sp.]|uniref:hypothetical protein n=1 Tax=Huintestinicola sp. TaxID=2981661 RepID=UPI003D7CD897